MNNLQIPNKVAWHVDLRLPFNSTWSTSILAKIRKPIYDQVQVIWLDSSEIQQTFKKFYIDLITTKSDYRLDKKNTLNKIDDMANKHEYKLVVAKKVRSSEIIGGVVVKITNEECKIAYRAFDHVLASQLKMKELDYYVDMSIQNKMRDMSYKILSHGNDTHPLTQVGLSCYKLRVGARPVMSDKAVLAESNSLNWVGYYTDPIGGVYTKYCWVRRDMNTINEQFEHLLARAEIQVVG